MGPRGCSYCGGVFHTSVSKPLCSVTPYLTSHNIAPHFQQNIFPFISYNLIKHRYLFLQLLAIRRGQLLHNIGVSLTKQDRNFSTISDYCFLL